MDIVRVSKKYPQSGSREPLVVLNDVTLKIPILKDGQIVVLLGPSGCGKTTLLRLLSGLTEPDEGEIRIFGDPITNSNPYSATVQQAYTCFPWLTALGNVEFGLALQGRSSSDRRRIAIEYLTKVGLKDRLASYPKQLSGGMQQRVAIARTLAVNPKIILMDEPFGALDAQTRSEMQQMLLDIWQEEMNTIIFVTHDITEAILLGTRILVFSKSPAEIVLDRDVDLPRPRRISDPATVELMETILAHLKGAPARTVL
ncbi:MAG: ABC transporter ATP-binding protein [Capsulimonadaceae bacterium]